MATTGQPTTYQPVGSEYYNDGRAQHLKPQGYASEQVQQSPQLLAQEMQRAQQVIAHRASQGLDISAQEKYLASLGGQKGSNMLVPEKGVQHNLIDASNYQVQQQTAMLELQKQQALKEVEMAFNQAVSDGEMSVREAEKAFAEQKKQIEQQAYQDAQVTNLTAQNRGIQNSMQLLGLQAGDNARNNSLKSQALTERDARILDIQDRIKQLNLQRGLEVSGINSQYQQGVIGAQAEANQQLNQQLFDWNSSVYQMDRQEKFEFEKMAKQHGYDLSMLSEQQRYNLETMAKQYGYDVAMQNLSHSQAVSRENLSHSNSLTRQQQAQQSEAAAREQALKWALESHDETTDAGKLAKLEKEAEIAQELEKADMKLLSDYMGQVEANALASGRPVEPDRSDFDKLWTFGNDKEDKEYNKALDKYYADLETYERALAKLEKYQNK